MIDKYHGQGGDFRIENGERVQVEAPGTPHPEGDCARDAEGKAHERAHSKIEPALPAPGPAPWATPAETDAMQSAQDGDSPRSRRKGGST